MDELDLLARSIPPPARRRRGLVRRTLVMADAISLSLAFLLAHQFDGSAVPGSVGIEPRDLIIFLLILPIWILAAGAHGLYERDGERADHSTVEELVAVGALVTLGSWLLVLGAWLTSPSESGLRPELVLFWVLAGFFVVFGRACARAAVRRRPAYVQRTVIVGAGRIGQLVARKLARHPEYGIELVGFVDADPQERSNDLERLTLLGPPERLQDLVRAHAIERVVFAFSRESAEETLELVRSIQSLDVQIDIVPRLFDALGPGAAMHMVEGLPLVSLSGSRPSRSWALAKRLIDIVGASVGLALTAPLFGVVAALVKLHSEGPIFFRQTRLTIEMRKFTMLKFRTMKAGTDESEHRNYVSSQLNGSPSLAGNGLFKLDQSGVVTPIGRWLRTTSLDELPQLINVLRGEMSLVGPRPCIPYETEHFQPYHFERFRVRAGLTGFWQVTARANASFAEALSMDVAYARSPSLGLDLRLMCRTPLELVRQRRSTS